ncbi:MAG: hypothetical protein PHE88_02215 [Elusimicrobia bacterium]|nr:hypothetical protein [Elusimicrobiota bacterium]
MVKYYVFILFIFVFSACAKKPSEEMAKCASDGMEMKASAMVKMDYDGKTLYFCNDDEMKKFMSEHHKVAS